MKKRSCAGVVAGIVALVSMTSVMHTGISAEDAGYTMNVSVKLDGERKSISPYIYGVNEYGNTDNLKNISVNAVRQGGNRYTGYNWETNWSNAGEDWHNSSDTNIGDITDGSAYAAQKLSKECEKHNVPYKLTTLQMAGYVAADKNGSVTESEKAPSARWNEVKFSKDSELSMTPDLNDGVVYMDEYVNYIVNTLGNSTVSTGIQGYSLDNEPVLWDNTHPMMHGESVTNNELVSKSIELAKVVKRIDPNAEVFGPAFWGMLPCVQAGEDGTGFVDSEWQSVKSNYTWYVDFYLDQMAKAEEECGYRLLDVFDVHYYAQDCSTDAARLQAARSLYDESYVENSWLQPYLGQYFPFLERLQESIDKYYPETKLAITEYNLADIANETTTGKSITAAIAETEALGAFALNEVYLATYWGTLPNCPYVESAINLYTNYDGKGGSFGDTLVEAETDDLSKAAAFAAVDEGDDSEVTLVLSNKDMTNTQNAVISLDGTDIDYTSAAVYAITQDDTDIRVIDVQNDISGNTVNVSLPPMSVAQIVISDEPSNASIYEEPDITKKEITYNISDLEKNDTGAALIPLGDVDHLVKAVITANASCSSGASWYCGGGALCFSNLIPEGSSEGIWGSKSFMYNTGGGQCEIVFDGSFADSNMESFEAKIGDTAAELQNWWASSANDDKGADVNVEYTSITLYYEYDKSESDTTTETTTTTTTTTIDETTTTTVTTVTSADTTTSSSAETTSSTTAESTESATTTSYIASDVKYGDVNLDNSISLLDVIILNKNIAGSVTLNYQQLKNAECCTDGSISSLDVTALLGFIVEHIDSLPVNP